MPIIRRTRPCITAYGVLHWLCGAGSQAVCTVWRLLLLFDSNFHTVHTACDPAPHNHNQHNQCRTPYAVIYGLVLLMMGIMMPETCWDRSLIINIGLVASCWFISLHPTSHDEPSQEPKTSWCVLYRPVKPVVSTVQTLSLAVQLATTNEWTSVTGRHASCPARHAKIPTY